MEEDVDKLIISEDSAEVPRNHEYLSQARAFGNEYMTFIQAVTSNRRIDNAEIATTLPEDKKEWFRQVKKSVKNNLERQATLFTEGEMDAVKLLGQVMDTEKIADPSQLRLREVGTGLYCILTDVETFSSFRENAQAVAVFVRDGISFIFASEVGDEGTTKDRLAENIPHEAHHILWRFLKSDGIVTSSESDVDIARAFLMYQDELIAKICGNARPLGYSHLQVNKSERLRLHQERPEVMAHIESRVQEANDLLIDELDPIRVETDTPLSDLLLPIMTARSFDKLQKNVDYMKGLIDTLPKSAEQPSDGWGRFSV